MPSGQQRFDRIDGEYRHAVALVADMVGSTQTTETLGAERAYLMIRQLTQAMSDVASQYNGITLKTVGDGIIALFGAPVASETAALDACRAGLAIVDKMSELGPSLRKEFGITPEVRIGIASGEVMVVQSAPDGFDATGSAMNLASRLEAFADPGQIVVEQGIVRDLAPLGKLDSLGHRKIKGLSDTRELYRLIGLAPATTSFEIRRSKSSSRMVGRDSELSDIRDWVLDRKAGPKLCVIEGPPGIGKSRMVDALCGDLSGKVKARFGNCLFNATDRILLSLVEVIRNELNKNADPEASQALNEDLSRLFREKRDPSALFVDVLSGQEGNAQKSYDHQAAYRLRSDVVEVIGKIASQSEKIVVIEDGHWIDTLSSDILQELVENGPSEIRIIVTARPGQAPKWMRAPAVKVVPLKSLAEDDVRDMADDILGGAKADASVIEAIAARSEGNPFFAEEMIRHIGLEGFERVEAIGSIQNIVFSRFDRLLPDFKQFLRFAAVEGRVFDTNVIKIASELPDFDIEKVLDNTGGLLEQAPGRPAEHLQFSHVLVRDVIFGSVPEIEKPAIHRSLGNTLESLTGGGPAVAEALADHFEASGDVGKAFSYQTTAASSALRRYALEACLARCERALESISAAEEPTNTDELAALIEVYVRCLDIIGEFRILAEVVSSYIERIPKGYSRTVCMTLWSKSLGHGAQFVDAIAVGDRAIREAESAGDDIGLAWARVVRMRNILDAGVDQPGEMHTLFDLTKEIGEGGSDFYLTTFRLYTMLAWHRRMGEFGKARELGEQLLAWSKEVGDSRGIGHGAWAMALISRFEQAVDVTLQYAKLSLENAVPGTSDYLVAKALDYTASIESALLDDPEVFTDIIDRTEQMGNYPLRNACLMQRAIGYFRVGKIKKGWGEFENAKDLLLGTVIREQENFMRIAECEILLSLGGMMPSQGPRPKLGLIDIFFVLTLRPSIRRRLKSAVEGIYKEAEAFGTGGYVLARASTIEGLMMVKSKPEQAREKIQMARQYYLDEGCISEVERLDAVEAQVLN